MRSEMIVIADDITGAAEMAGIAHCHGQQVRLLCSVCCDSVAAEREGTTVIATDTRSMTEDEAIAETRRITSHLSPLTPHLSPLTPHLFKKTDSALRGHVVAELKTLMETMGYQLSVQSIYQQIPPREESSRMVSTISTGHL